MIQLYNEFLEELQNGKKLVVLPLTRFILYKPFTVGSFKFFPADSIDVSSLHPVPNKTVEFQKNSSGVIELEGQALREYSTSLTGFSPEALRENPVVAFPIDLDWEEFISADHQYDICLLKKLSALAERALDIVRFDFCRFDLPDTLPGSAGSWEESSQYLGALLYSLDDNESYLIAGAAIVSTVVAKGIGLEINIPPTTIFPKASQGEVAGVASHGLALFSDAMTANNDTIKFIRIMTLLEFLASPYEYKKWKKIKGDIACHCSNSKSNYRMLMERFKELTSKTDADGNQKGYRTLVVHHGEFLEDIIQNEKDRKKLFLELQGYVGKVLLEMLKNTSKSWQEFTEYRKGLKKVWTF